LFILHFEKSIILFLFLVLILTSNCLLLLYANTKRFKRFTSYFLAILVLH